VPDTDDLLLDSSKPESSEKKGGLTRDEKKANANKRRKAEQAHFLAMSTCAINNSDESDVECDFGAEATWPLPDVKWTLPIKDFWEPQNSTNRQLRAIAPEESHQITQKEILAKCRSEEKPPLPLGRLKILTKALFLKTYTALNKAHGIRRFNLEFNMQQHVDHACIMDANCLLSVDYKSFNRKTQLLSVRVSSHTVSGRTTLQSLVEDKNKRSRLKRVDQTAIVDVNWLQSAAGHQRAAVRKQGDAA
jgi:hypothetical protein